MQVSLRSNLMTLFIKAKRVRLVLIRASQKIFIALFINECIDSSGNTHVLETFFYFLSKDRDKRKRI